MGKFQHRLNLRFLALAIGIWIGIAPLAPISGPLALGVEFGKPSCEDFLSVSPEKLGKIRKSFKHSTRYQYDIESTEVRDQCGFGGCWTFATVAELETQILNQTGKKIDLSEEFVIAHTLIHRSLDALEQPGQKIIEGGFVGVARWIIQNYGIVPTKAWKPRVPFLSREHASRMMYFLNARVARFHEETNGINDPNQKEELKLQAKAELMTILLAYFGELPTEFEFEGKKYEDGSAFAKSLGILESENLARVIIRHEDLNGELKVLADSIESRSIKSHRTIPQEVTEFNGSLRLVERFILMNLKNGQSVPFSFEFVNAFYDRESGIMSLGAYYTPAGFQPASKAYRDDFDLVEGGHAVLIVGANVDSEGHITQLKIKNSYGTQSGDAGYIHMYRDYFEAFAKWINIPKSQVTALKARLAAKRLAKKGQEGQ